MRSIIKTGLGCFSITLNILLLFLFFGGCSSVDRDEAAVFFVPPTPASGFAPPTEPVTPTPIQDEVATFEALPTPTPPCADSLRYVEDLSIPDGSQVSPGEKLDKRWTVENDGSCNWDKNYNLRLIAGSDMGASAEQALYPARSGSQATIRIIFTAPTEPGVYRSAWQAHNPAGQPFGDPVFIEVQVGG
jgi:hypothetical protein